MEIHGFHHVALWARNVECVAAFYREILELPEIQRFYRDDGELRSIWISTRNDGVATRHDFLAIEAIDGDLSRASSGFCMVALSIAEEEKASVILRLRSKGVAIEKHTQWTVYFRDPEGNLMGLSHYAIAPSHDAPLTDRSHPCDSPR